MDQYSVYTIEELKTKESHNLKATGGRQNYVSVYDLGECVLC